MKTLSVLISFVVFSFAGYAQQSDYALPSVSVKKLDGSTISTTEMTLGEVTIVSFWATWCKPCILELSTIADVYEDWQAETGVNLIAISIDDARNAPKVKPFVEGKGWEYSVYIDENSDFKRAMNVVNVPHTFVLNKEGKIVWQHNSYSPGDEEELYEIIIKVKNGESLESHE